MQIRNAKIDDIDRLSEFILWGQDLHVRSYPGIFAPVNEGMARSFLLESLDSKTAEIRVAESQSVIAGFTFIEIRELSASFIRLPRRFAYLELIAVAPQFQRSGVGSALLTDAANIARSHGIERIELDVMSLNEGARRFFSNQGFSELGCRMYRDEPAS